MVHRLNVLIEAVIVLLPASFIDSACFERSVYTSEALYAPIVSSINIVRAANTRRMMFGYSTVDGIMLTPTVLRSYANSAFSFHLLNAAPLHSRPNVQWKITTALKQQKSRTGTMRENGVFVEERIAQVAIQSVSSKYAPSFRPISHPSPLKIPLQRHKSLHSQLHSFQS